MKSEEKVRCWMDKKRKTKARLAQLRTLALYQEAETIETDHEQRVIRGVSLIQAVEALGHDMMIDEVTLGAAPTRHKDRQTRQH